MASSSPVETPGRSSDSTSARTSATIRPARRIFAISAGETTDEILGRNLDVDCAVHPHPPLGERRVERFGLPPVARKPVEDRAGCRVAPVQPVQQHLDGDLIGHELAALHVGRRFAADLRTLPGGRAKDVAGRDVGHTQPLGEDGRLGALARARRTENDHDHQRMKPS